MQLSEFKQQLLLKLAGNPEFVKGAEKNYNGEAIGYCVATQLLQVLQTFQSEE